MTRAFEAQILRELSVRETATVGILAQATSRSPTDVRDALDRMEARVEVTRNRHTADWRAV